MTADRKDSLYYVREAKDNYDINTEIANTTQAEIATEEWHRKMGHLNIRDLIECHKKGVVQGMTIGKLPQNFNCETCLQGKMIKLPFPKASSRKSEVLEIIYSDVCGQIRVESNGKARYVATFIDDHS